MNQNGKRRRGGRGVSESNPERPVMIVDVSQYRSFCFRGEGKANVVISGKHRQTGERIVWRFAKQRKSKSGELTCKKKSEVAGVYMEKMMAPLLDDHFLVQPTTVEMLVGHVHQLAKLPSLPENVKMESLADLEAEPEELSRLKLASVTPEMKTILCLQMIDATCIPKRFTTLPDRSTVTLEIKPKQGYYQNHKGIDLPYCNNCILQIEKCSGEEQTYDSMYDFCPLALFSHDEELQRHALESLIDDPHRNLRVFLDGTTILSEKNTLSRKELEKMVFKDGEATIDDLLDGVLAVLNVRGLAKGGSIISNRRSTDGGHDQRNGHEGREDSPSSLSLLDQLLAGQKLDELGIVGAHDLFVELKKEDKDVADKLGRKEQSAVGLDFLHDGTRFAKMKRYFLAATLKDCSVMISLRLLDEGETVDELVEGSEMIPLPNGKRFAYLAKIVDLDPKSPKNMFSAYKRLQEGAERLKKDRSLRKPCPIESI